MALRRSLGRMGHPVVQGLAECLNGVAVRQIEIFRESPIFVESLLSPRKDVFDYILDARDRLFFQNRDAPYFFEAAQSPAFTVNRGISMLLRDDYTLLVISIACLCFSVLLIVSRLKYVSKHRDIIKDEYDDVVR